MKGRQISANFSGGNVTSDGGALLLRQIDRRLGLCDAVSRVVSDQRDPRYCDHNRLDLIRQRVFSVALGYEDLNDHNTLRLDPALQSAVSRDVLLASQSTLHRFENQMDRATAVDVHKVILDTFINAFKSPPKSLTLDFDATDDRVHGNQDGTYYHGYYGHYCFLPLYVFCENHMLVSYLRRSSVDGAKHAWAILALLVRRLRQEWPAVKILFRADGGFCRHRLLSWCDAHEVDFVVGFTRNNRLKKIIGERMDEVQKAFDKDGEKQRAFMRFPYMAKKWRQSHSVIAKLEITGQGQNPRFIITSLGGDAQAVYDEIYCARGDMENRIKEQQMGLFADRTSAHDWWPNQWRLLVSALAYVLMDGIRRVALEGTKMAKAQMTTIRLKLFKIGAVILKNTRRVQFLLSSLYPDRALFQHVCARLAPD